MSINSRIKEIRKSHKMNQHEFAKALGLTQSGVSYIEKDGSNPSDASIKIICSLFNVREEWLRNGIEPMKAPATEMTLDDFLEMHDVTELEEQIMRTYFELPTDIRKDLINHFKNGIAKTNSAPVSIDDAEAEYIKSRCASAPKEISSVSSTTDDDQSDQRIAK